MREKETFSARVCVMVCQHVCLTVCVLVPISKCWLIKVLQCKCRAKSRTLRDTGGITQTRFTHMDALHRYEL